MTYNVRRNRIKDTIAFLKAYPQGVTKRELCNMLQLSVPSTSKVLRDCRQALQETGWTIAYDTYYNKYFLAKDGEIVDDHIARETRYDITRLGTAKAMCQSRANAYPEGSEQRGRAEFAVELIETAIRQIERLR